MQFPRVELTFSIQGREEVLRRKNGSVINLSPLSSSGLCFFTFFFAQVPSYRNEAVIFAIIKGVDHKSLMPVAGDGMFQTTPTSVAP